MQKGHVERQLRELITEIRWCHLKPESAFLIKTRNSYVVYDTRFFSFISSKHNTKKLQGMYDTDR